MAQEEGNGKGVAAELANWSLTFDYDSIPAAVIEISKDHILDTLGVGFAAAGDSVARILYDFGEGWGAGDCSALGLDRRLSPSDAAFVNGTMFHALDFDDYAVAGGHPSACIVPALLGGGEQRRASGRALLTAYTVAMDVASKIPLHAPDQELQKSGWHTTGIYGLLAATVASGIVRGLDADRLGHAIAIGASMGVGIRRNFGTMVKPMHVGRAAEGGVRAALLAEAGLTGRATALEGEFGFNQAYFGGRADWYGVLRSLQEPLRWASAPATIKAYPSCGGTHRFITSTVDIMRGADLKASDIMKIHVIKDPRLDAILQYDWPRNHYEAKFSLLYTVAVAAQYGPPTSRWFQDDAVTSPELLQMAERIEIEKIPEAQRTSPIVTIATADGTIWPGEEEVAIPGSPQRPMSRDEVVEKFRGNTADALSENVIDDLVGSVSELDVAGEAFWRAWREAARLACRVR